MSGEGIGNPTGDAGAAGSVGTVIQLMGVLTAVVAGIMATGQEYRSAR